MARTNDAAAALLSEYAELLVLAGEDPFRARNYEKAAKTVGGYPADIAGLGAAGLRRIPGVGASIAAKIAEFLATGDIEVVAALRARVPAGIRELNQVPGVGPRRAVQLYRELGLASVADLEAAVRAGRLRKVSGFGPKSEQRLLRALAVMTPGQVRLDVAMDVSARLSAALRPLAGQVAWAGEARRMRESAGSVHIVASAAAGPDARALTAAFAALADGDAAADAGADGGADADAGAAAGDGPADAPGPQAAEIRAGGLRAVLHVAEPGSFGAALARCTGSPAHHGALAQLAASAGLELGERGLARPGGELVAGATEEALYAALGMAWVPPPLREDRGEVEAARRGQLPTLITTADIKGDLHSHTSLTDGVATMAEMAAAAAARGLCYLAITDHAPNLVMQRMTKDKALAQRAELAALQEATAVRLLHGTELNIAPDGTVDWEEEFLAGFDICVASVHSHFDLPRAQMTRRLIAACEHPRVNIIGHPLTRKVGSRPPVDVDFGELFRACARTGTALEVNASPWRLDLPAEHIAAAREAGVKFAIDTDAHAAGDFDDLPYGVGTAQRGWLSAADVINAWPLAELAAFLRKKG